MNSKLTGWVSGYCVIGNHAACKIEGNGVRCQCDSPDCTHPVSRSPKPQRQTRHLAVVAAAEPPPDDSVPFVIPPPESVPVSANSDQSFKPDPLSTVDNSDQPGIELPAPPAPTVVSPVSGEWTAQRVADLVRECGEDETPWPLPGACHCCGEKTKSAKAYFLNGHLATLQVLLLSIRRGDDDESHGAQVAAAAELIARGWGFAQSKALAEVDAQAAERVTQLGIQNIIRTAVQTRNS